ncbi:hypothetical protein Q3G72_020840 [Acer saccharum]|nr:hypothetical protein Q3G72_020840 [Acer saccharum]
MAEEKREDKSEEGSKRENKVLGLRKGIVQAKKTSQAYSPVNSLNFLQVLDKVDYFPMKVACNFSSLDSEFNDRNLEVGKVSAQVFKKTVGQIINKKGNKRLPTVGNEGQDRFSKLNMDCKVGKLSFPDKGEGEALDKDGNLRPSNDNGVKDSKGGCVGLNISQLDNRKVGRDFESNLGHTRSDGQSPSNVKRVKDFMGVGVWPNFA